VHQIKRIVFIAIISFLLCSCNEKKQESLDFPFFLHEKCMIINTEQDNSIEGTYLKVLSGGKTEKILTNLPENFYINKSNFKNWVTGWGSNVPLYDAGVENIRQIDTILPDNTIKLGKLMRGSGYPDNDQRIVFWNKQPTGFVKESGLPVLDTKQFNRFHGKSIQFSGLVYVYALNSRVMFFNESDHDTIMTYVATSENLINWNPDESGKPLFTPSDFKNIPWANGKAAQTPVVRDIQYFSNKWYLFLDGYDNFGKRHIGLAVSDGSILGPYKIKEQALVSPGKKGSWNDNSCFYAKVCRYKDKFIMFYDGRNSKGEENIGMAYSYDLAVWTEHIANPVINEHQGWRSSPGVSEPAYIEVHGDSIFLLVAGAKKFKMGAWHHYITRRMYLDKSGNVNDAQLGVYLSTDGGKSFIPHVNNPVFTNNYADDTEDGHLGACFSFIKTDSANYIFYLAKKENAGYNIFCRTLKK